MSESDSGLSTPGHPIADSPGDWFAVAETELESGPVAVPEPDGVVFVSWFEGGTVFHSDCSCHRATSRIFSFRPGHDTCARIIRNTEYIQNK